MGDSSNDIINKLKKLDERRRDDGSVSMQDIREVRGNDPSIQMQTAQLELDVARSRTDGTLRAQSSQKKAISSAMDNSPTLEEVMERMGAAAGNKSRSAEGPEL